MATARERWFDAWQQAVRLEQLEPLPKLLQSARDLPHKDVKEALLDALDLANQHKSLGLLRAILGPLKDVPELRAEALEVVLELADERKPEFQQLLPYLTQAEQLLVLGALLEASRLDPDPERRLYRLSLLLALIPQEVRSLYWGEAERLAARGGDDAQLLLLGLAHRLSSSAKKATFAKLAKAISKLSEPYKYASAAALLIELGIPLALLDLQKVFASASAIPDPRLRVEIQTRLHELTEGRL